MKAGAIERAETGEVLEVPVDVLEIGLAAAGQEGGSLGLSTVQSLEALKTWRNGQPLTGKVRVEVAGGMPVVITPERTLTLAAGEYRSNRESPEALYGLMEAFWNNFRAESTRSGGNLASSDLQLSDCPFTAEDLNNFRQKPVPDIGFFLPKILADIAGILLLRAGFPKMSIYVQDEGQISYIPRAGWTAPESVLFAPNVGTTQKEAEKIFLANNRLPMTPNVFIALSGLMKVLEGRYIDEQSVSRLLGDLIQGKAAIASFGSLGDCFVRLRCFPGDRDRDLGARSLGVKS